MIRLVLTLSFLITYIFCSSQSLNIGFIFKPGFTFGGEYTSPAPINDTSTFQINKFRAQFTLPLKTKIGVKADKNDILKLKFKKIDIKASQTFFMFNTSVRQPHFENIAFKNQHIYTVSTGITRLSAGIKNGIWMYSGNIYISESAKTITNKPQLNALAYATKVKLNNLKFIYFYGVAGIYNFGRFIPVPIGGFTSKIGLKWRITAILPIQMKLTYKINKKNNIDIGTSFNGFNAVYRDIDDVFMNYRQLKNHIILNSKVGKQFNLSVESGLSTWRNITFIDKNKNSSPFNVKSAFYASISLNYNFGKSLLNMKLEGVD